MRKLLGLAFLAFVAFAASTASVLASSIGPTP